jgi:amino acid adenylation domain-containing protein
VTQAHEFGARRAVTSAAQDGLWFVDTCVHDVPTYQVCRAYRVRGELRVDSLRTAWSGLVARHESLRTTLVSRDGRPLQLIAGERADVLSFDDLGAVPALTDDAEARRWCADLAATPLDLATGPLARLAVARVSASEHLIVLLLHQAVTDEESTSILIEELSGAYSAELAGGTAHELPAPRAQYADFARWQRRRTASGRFRALVDWWADALSPAPPQLTLPADRVRSGAPGGHGGLLAFDWGERIAAPLARLCGASRTTPFAALLTAYQALLHRYGGDERIAVAVPVPVRSRPEFARLIGACREPVVVCADVSGRPSFRELLGRVTVTAEDALRHRGLPFDQLVRTLNVDRDLRVPPLSEAAFVFRQDPEAELDLVGTLVRALPLDSTVVRADLTLSVDRIDGTVAGSLAFRSSMFERTSAQRVLDQLHTLLAGALADPDLPVDALPLDEPRRLRAAVRDADWIGVGEPVRLTVAEQVHRVAERQPDAPAVVLGEESLTYRELVDRAAVLTAALLAGDGVAGRAVAVRMPSGPRQIVALLGVLDAGAHLVSIGTGDNGQRGRAVLADLRPACLVLDGMPDSYELIDWYRDELDGRIIDLADLSPATEPATASGPTNPNSGPNPSPSSSSGPDSNSGSSSGPNPSPSSSSGPDSNSGSSSGPNSNSGSSSGPNPNSNSGPNSNSNSNVGDGDLTPTPTPTLELADRSSLATAAGQPNSNVGVGVGNLTPASTPAPIPTPTPTLGLEDRSSELADQVQLQRCSWIDDRAYVAYTSGSTGRPKGIAQTHRGFAQFIGWWSGEFVAGPSARVAQWAASGYDASLVEIFGALVAGATVYQVPEKIRANPEKTVEWLAAERITVLQTVPSFAREVGRAITAAGAAASLTALDHLLLAGEALPGELAGALRSVLPGVRLVNLYGPTESILATWHEVTGPVRGPVPIGRPIPGRQVLVLDNDDRPCPAGTVGQVVIRSPYIVPGYVGAAAPERSAFRPVAGLEEYGAGTCYRTGDFARRRWDGLLEFRGRGDFQVKFHGTRVELTDVEATLLSHESVAECAVVGVPNADGLVTRLVAYVVPRRAADGRAVAGAEVWRAHLRGWFGRSKLPVSFKTVIGLPRNLGGKVDRQRLPDPGPSTVVAARPPRTSVERVMTSIWAELVGTAPDSADDSFFAAGGHSLLVPQLLDRIRDRFGVAVSVREYVPNPTVAGLSGLVDGKLISAMSVTDKVMGEKT